MQKLEFIQDKNQELIKAIVERLPFFSRFDVQKLLKSKDIKINNNRISENITTSIGDKITVFYSEKQQKTDSDKSWYTVVYNDDNILIVNKRAGIEVISEKERDLISVIRQRYKNVFLVHRIDRNTEGLVMFALNECSEKELLAALQTRKGIIKKYILLAHGKAVISKIKRTVYLKKVEKLSKVWISEVKTTGYDQIITDFRVIKYMDNVQKQSDISAIRNYESVSSMSNQSNYNAYVQGQKANMTLLEANLITGKTHQIRAHISYYGYPIVGDQKYGKDDSKELCLTANYIGFAFPKNSLLEYMNKKSFEIAPSWF